MIDGTPLGASSYIIEVMVFDSSSTTGAGLTALTNASSGLLCYYKTSAATVSAAVTLKTVTTFGTYAGTATVGAFKEVDSTNMKGVYEFHVPNNFFSATATPTNGLIMLSGATNMVPVPLYFRFNPPADLQTILQTAVATPATAGVLDTNIKNINNAALNTALAQLGVNLVNISGSAVTTGTAQIGANMMQINNLSTGSVVSVNANQGTVQPLNFTGTGTTAYPKVDVTDIATAAVNASLAQLGVNLVNISGSAVATGTAQIGTNVVQINAVSTASVVSVNANQGSVQPFVFTGTGSSALAKVDVTDIATAAVATGSAQLGVNVVNMGGSALSTTSAQVGVNLINVAGSAVTTGTAQIGANVVSQNNIDFGALQKASLITGASAATPNAFAVTSAVTVGTVNAGSINNAAFNADVNTTAYATNNLALMMYKFFDNAFTGYSDGSTFTSNGFLDRFTKTSWIIRNQINVIDVSGNTTIYKDDNVTSAFSVAAMLTDTAGTTTRLRAQ